MSDDLIGRKTLLDSMDKRYEEKFDVVQDGLAEGFVQMEKLIKEQPTAYDVDKVVKRLENAKTNFIGMGTLQSAYFDKGIDKAIEIVKSGGVSND